MNHFARWLRLLGTLTLLWSAVAWAQEDFAGLDAIIIYDIVDDRLVDPMLNPVSEDLEFMQDDIEAHQFLWELFAAVIPAEIRFDIIRFSIFFTDDGRTAFVESVAEQGFEWVLGINFFEVLEYEETGDVEELLDTVLHEFGHVFTLGTGEVIPDFYVIRNPDDEAAEREASANCDTYFTGDGCSLEDSSLSLFIEYFWADIIEEFGEDVDPEELYMRYPDDFITEYAATDPMEDIAESWAQFVLKPPPLDDSIAAAKVNFFYEFPELVELREVILANIEEFLAFE